MQNTVCTEYLRRVTVVVRLKAKVIYDSVYKHRFSASANRTGAPRSVPRAHCTNDIERKRYETLPCILSSRIYTAFQSQQKTQRCSAYVHIYIHSAAIGFVHGRKCSKRNPRIAVAGDTQTPFTTSPPASSSLFSSDPPEFPHPPSPPPFQKALSQPVPPASTPAY